MKRIEVIIPRGDLEAIAHALAVEGVRGMTLSAVHGWGIGHGLGEREQAEIPHIRVVPKLKVDMVVPRQEADAVVGRLRQVLDSSDVGPGKIFVLDVQDVAHTQSDERG